MTVADKSLKERMFGLAQCSWDGKIQFTQGGELRIGWTEAGVLDIEAPDLSGRARGLFWQHSRSRMENPSRRRKKGILHRAVVCSTFHAEAF